MWLQERNYFRIKNFYCVHLPHIDYYIVSKNVFIFPQLFFIEHYTKLRTCILNMYEVQLFGEFLLITDMTFKAFKKRPGKTGKTHRKHIRHLSRKQHTISFER